jgi:hypothetical protein
MQPLNLSFEMVCVDIYTGECCVRLRPSASGSSRRKSYGKHIHDYYWSLKTNGKASRSCLPQGRVVIGSRRYGGRAVR